MINFWPFDCQFFVSTGWNRSRFQVCRTDHQIYECIQLLQKPRPLEARQVQASLGLLLKRPKPNFSSPSKTLSVPLQNCFEFEDVVIFENLLSVLPKMYFSVAWLIPGMDPHRFQVFGTIPCRKLTASALWEPSCTCMLMRTSLAFVVVTTCVVNTKIWYCLFTVGSLAGWRVLERKMVTFNLTVHWKGLSMAVV